MIKHCVFMYVFTQKRGRERESERGKKSPGFVGMLHVCCCRFCRLLSVFLSLFPSPSQPMFVCLVPVCDWTASHFGTIVNQQSLNTWNFSKKKLETKTKIEGRNTK